MTQKEIWQYCLHNNIWEAKIFGKHLLLLSENNFKNIEKHFWKDVNAFHMFTKKRTSLKSKSYWKHIHAVKKWDLYFVHEDYWNYNKFIPLYFAHLIIDVIPRFTFCIFKRKNILFCLDENIYKKAR